MRIASSATDHDNGTARGTYVSRLKDIAIFLRLNKDIWGGGRVKNWGNHGRPGCPYGSDPAAPSIAQLVNRKCVVKLHIIKLVVLSDIFVRETEITQLRLALQPHTNFR